MRKNLIRLSALFLSAVLLFGHAANVYADENTSDPQQETEAQEADSEEAAEDVSEEAESEESAETEPYGADLIDPLAVPEETDKLNITRDTIASNVYFRGESLSGLSLEEGVEKVAKVAEAIRESEFIIKSERDETHIFGADTETLGITLDDSKVSETLEGTIIHGNLLERYKQAKDIQADPVVIDLNLQASEERILDYFNTELESWNHAPVDATFDVSFGQVSVTEGSDGYACDFTYGINKLVKDLYAYNFDEEMDYYIDIEEKVLEPEFTTEHAKQFTLIGSCTTPYPAPTTEFLRNRENNLIVSTRNMSGKRFPSGTRISALHNLYGDVSEAGGYLPAGTINGAGHTKEIGGGICQTTTTLYDALLQAELQIDFRNHHSKLVTYVDPSFDAMVYAAGDSDFIFTNSTPDDIIIEAYVDTNSQTMTVNIIGVEEHSESHRVEYVSVIEAVVAPDVAFVPNTSVPLGYKDVSKKIQLIGDDGPQCGITSHLVKRVYEGDTVTEEKIISRDIYKPDSASYLVSPDAMLLVGTTGPRENAFVSLTQVFADGITPLSADPARMTEEERIAFNQRMKKATGGAWPYSGDGYTNDKPNGTQEEETEPETTKSGKKDDGKKDTKAPSTKPTEKETTTTAAPEPSPEPAPEPAPEDSGEE